MSRNVYIVVDTLKDDWSEPSMRIFAKEDDALAFFREHVVSLELNLEDAEEHINEVLVAECGGDDIVISVWKRKVE